ncbi:MAG: alpha/beta fold hydrolase [Bacteroidota bacterium]
MPLLENSDFHPPLWLRNPHIQTIYAGLIRPLPEVAYQRERWETPDGDFLDLDWSRVGGRQLVLVLHGLEGSADRPYSRGIVRVMNEAGWDGLGLNFRGCSGEINRLARAYHSGETEDVRWVLRKIIASGSYERIALVGFSLGGNVTLKYLGEEGSGLASEIVAGVAISVPVDLESCSHELSRWYNYPYLLRFLRSLKASTLEKRALLPEHIDLDAVLSARDFKEFDDVATAPLHGFKNAVDYWTQSSSKPFLADIRIPTLILNAADDTFLSAACYPREIARRSTFVHLEVPKWGGHVGFVHFDASRHYWSEQRVCRFLREH